MTFSSSGDRPLVKHLLSEPNRSITCFIPVTKAEIWSLPANLCLKPSNAFFTQILEETGDDHPRLMMTWEEVTEAASQGIMVGAHTHHHPIMFFLDRQDQEREIAVSLEMIAQNLQRKVTLFSYPEGGSESFGSETLELLKTLGISAAFTTHNGVNRGTENPFLLKRIGINPSDPVV